MAAILPPTLVSGIIEPLHTDDHLVGDIACSLSLLDTPEHPGRRIFVTQKLRYECKGTGNEVTIPEEELNSRLPDPDATMEDNKRRLERGKI
jgi:hypothetical protein